MPMQMLTIVIGLIFILLLLSLLATTIMELVAGFLQLRGKNLEKALKNILASSDADERILEAFKNNALYKQLSYQFGQKKKAPTYVSAQSFQSILFNILLEGGEQNLDSIRKSLEKLENEDLKNVLLQLLDESEDKLDTFKARVEGWYNDVMDRATSWYKENTRRILLMIGFALAVAFNADTIAIYKHLGADPQARMEILGMAERFVAQRDSLPFDTTKYASIDSIYKRAETLVLQDLEAARTPLGLGWDSDNDDKNDPMGFWDWLFRIAGWIVTALAVSLGAPFWFDLLKKLVNIRSSSASA